MKQDINILPSPPVKTKEQFRIIQIDIQVSGACVWLTLSSVGRGEWLQTTSFTEIQTGKATPRSICLPSTFFVYSLAACASMTVCPNSHKSIILAPGMHWLTNPCNARFTIFDASWYLVQTSLRVRLMIMMHGKNIQNERLASCRHKKKPICNYSAQAKKGDHRGSKRRGRSVNEDRRKQTREIRKSKQHIPIRKIRDLIGFFFFDFLNVDIFFVVTHGKMSKNLLSTASEFADCQCQIKQDRNNC